MEPNQPLSRQESVPMVSETRTRSGRVSKPPVRYEPIEQVEDDYDSDDYDSVIGDSDAEDDDDESEEFSDEDDADEDGNLDGFVVADKSESDEEYNGRAPPTSVPVVKKRARSE